MKRNLIYHAHIPFANKASIKTQSGGAIITELEAIAKDGVTLACDRQTLDQLLPNRIGVTQGVIQKQPEPLGVSFALNKSSDTVEASCTVMAVRRLARDTFQIVLRFKDITDQNFDNIDRYIDDTMKSCVTNTRKLRQLASRLATLGKVA